MHRLVLIASLIVAAHASAARAQSPVYVAGDVFLDVQRGPSSNSSASVTPDATVGGGGVRVGTFLASRWSLELGVDGSAAAESNFTVASTDSVSGRTGLSIPIPSLPTVVASLSERARTRVTATSVLLGYHTPPRGRLTTGFKGGLTFVRRSSTVSATTTYTITDPRLAPVLTLPSPITISASAVNFSTAAMVSAELAIALSRHAAVVPELRAFGFDGLVFLRPGAELRWLF